MNGRVIFLNRFYWPDETATAQLLTDLAEGLVARGRAVTVIASLPPGSRQRREERGGVRILRVPSTRGTSRGVISKAWDFLTFHLWALVVLWRAARRADAVVALTDPPLIGVGAAAVAGLRGARLYHWVQDIYPEVAIVLSGHRSLGLLGAWRDGAWQRARTCVTLGADMAAVLTAARVTPAIFPNWAPGGLRPPPRSEVDRIRASWGLTNQFIVGYSGNLGRVHDLDSIIELAEKLRHDPEIWFVLVGGGPQRRQLEEAAAQRGLRQIRFLPPAPRADLAASLGSADLQLVTLRPGCERCVFPSKLYGVAAVGRPVLFIGRQHSEIAQTVVRHGMGGAFDRTNLASAADLVRSLQASPALLQGAADRALRFAALTPGAEAAAAAWEQWLFPGRDIDLTLEVEKTATRHAG